MRSHTLGVTIREEGLVRQLMIQLLMILAMVLFAAPPSRAQAAEPQHTPVPQSSNQQPSSTSPESQRSKPCPDHSQKTGKPADCKPRTSTRAKKDNPADSSPPAQDPGAGPTKTVVRNGSTTDPIVAISPEDDSQNAQQISDTNRLLANTDGNLKQVATRQLTTEQQDTVSQIKVYMEQARRAAKNGEVQRAYNLANKADMLSADLLRPNP